MYNKINLYDLEQTSILYNRSIKFFTKPKQKGNIFYSIGTITRIRDTNNILGNKLKTLAEEMLYKKRMEFTSKYYKKHKKVLDKIIYNVENN